MKRDQLDFSGHVALVTGANHGIGRATAHLLAARGAAVLVTYLRTELAGETEAYARNRMLDGQEVAEAIVQSGGKAFAFEADLSDVSAIPALFDVAERHFGPVDILINNATGHAANDSFFPSESGRQAREPLNADLMDKNFAIDARASGLLISEFARRHVDRDGNWGRIVGLTSGGALGFPGEVTYGAAKAAMDSYAMSAAVELADMGITSNMVHPPVTDTGWVTDEVREFVGQSDEHFHIAEPEDVAEVIAYVCSDSARMITGNIIRMR